MHKIFMEIWELVIIISINKNRFYVDIIYIIIFHNAQTIDHTNRPGKRYFHASDTASEGVRLSLKVDQFESNQNSPKGFLCVKALSLESSHKMKDTIIIKHTAHSISNTSSPFFFAYFINLYS